LNDHDHWPPCSHNDLQWPVCLDGLAPPLLTRNAPLNVVDVNGEGDQNRYLNRYRNESIFWRYVRASLRRCLAWRRVGGGASEGRESSGGPETGGDVARGALLLAPRWAALKTRSHFPRKHWSRQGIWSGWLVDVFCLDNSWTPVPSAVELSLQFLKQTQKLTFTVTKCLLICGPSSTARGCVALSVWGGHLTNQQRQRISAFLKRYRKSASTETLLYWRFSDGRLFGRLLNRAHCLYHISPGNNEFHHLLLRKRGIYLPFRSILIYDLYKRSFVPRRLFKLV